MKKVVKDIFAILDRKEKTTLGTLIVFDVIISVLDIAFLVALLFIVQFLTQTVRTTWKPRFDVAVLDKSPLLLIGAFFLFFSLKNLAGFLVLRGQLRFVYQVASRLSRNNLASYLEGPYDGFAGINSSVHIRKISQHPIEFGHHVLGGFQQIVGQAMLILITVAVTLIYNPMLFLLLFIILTPPIILTGFLIRRKMNRVRRTAKPVSEMALQHLQEALAGYVESRIYASGDFFVDRYDTCQTTFNGFLADQQVIQNVPSRLIEVFAVLGFFVLVLINSYTGDTGALQLITIGAFMGAAYKIIPGIVKILNSVGQIRTYAFTAADLVHEQGSCPDPDEGAVEAVRSITFSGVSFSYGKGPVLDDFSMSLSAGEMVGLSGASGMGKTTVINLLFGFFEPSSGSICINGLATPGPERRRYWQRMAYVKQQPFILSDTVLKNIVLNERVDDPARLDTLIRQLGLQGPDGIFPEGPEKILTEDGRNISGGQRQRVAFARALYKRADLLVLDEPFNELDEASEIAMLEYCRLLAGQGMAILLITHNKKSLASCHKIISLHEA